MPREDWQQYRRCDPGTAGAFFDDTSQVHIQPSIHNRLLRWRGKRVCGPCPVAEECLAYGERTNAIFGTFGGLDQRERYILRTPRPRPVHVVIMALLLSIEGVTFDRIADRLGVEAGRLLDMVSRYESRAAVREAVAQYRAWPDIESGMSPTGVSRTHMIGYSTASEMCAAMDRLPDYTGPKKRERWHGEYYGIGNAG